MSIDLFLNSLGYEDDSEVIPPSEKKGLKLLYEFGHKKIIIFPYVIVYQNKKSYLNVEYEYSNYYDNNPEITKQKILNLIENIRYPEPGRVGDVGWDAKYLMDPTEFTKKERSYIAVSSFKKFKDFLKTGMSGECADPGDIICSKPIGIKFDKGFNDDSEQEGTLQRSILSKKVFSFGELKEDGMQYAVYGEDRKLHPI